MHRMGSGKHAVVACRWERTGTPGQVNPLGGHFIFEPRLSWLHECRPEDLHLLAAQTYEALGDSAKSNEEAGTKLRLSEKEQLQQLD